LGDLDLIEVLPGFRSGRPSYGAPASHVNVFFDFAPIAPYCYLSFMATARMSSAPSDLEGLRRRLDEIDDGLQRLLIERADVVSLVAAHKRGLGTLAPFQPAREAEILRRLAARHRGLFPLATLVRMWREMLAATLRIQTRFAVAVFAPPEQQGFWDLARDHYGSHTPMTPYQSASQVIRAVSDGAAAVGVLPMPQEGDTDPCALGRRRRAGDRALCAAADGRGPHALSHRNGGAH
jgi:chorismate mutase